MTTVERPLPSTSRTAVRRQGIAGALVVGLMLVLCVGLLPWSFGRAAGDGDGRRRFEATNIDAALLPPSWAAHAGDERLRRHDLSGGGDAAPVHLFGTDRLGRDLFWRVLAGGGISLGIGLVAAALAVFIGTTWGTVAGWSGPRVDAIMMRSVDVLYGLPYILLVVLLAVAVDGLLERGGDEISPAGRQAINVVTLWIAIGAVSWLTMARVIRGQVLSLSRQPFMESCRAIGVPRRRQFFVHLLPNLLGPIIVYATLTVPMAILSEAFLSFLGIGVREPLPSWGNLAADGLSELNMVRTRWWLLLWPCLFIGVTLLALNFVGEWLRERLDPRRSAA